MIGGPIGSTLTRRFNFVPRFFFRRGFAQPVTREVRDLYLAPWRDPHRRAPAVIAPRQLIAASEYAREVEAGLPTLAGRPTLIVWGERDFAFRQTERERFESAFPHHQTVLYPDASHFLQEDVGDRIAEQIKAFRADTAIG